MECSQGVVGVVARGQVKAIKSGLPSLFVISMIHNLNSYLTTGLLSHTVSVTNSSNFLVILLQWDLQHDGKPRNSGYCTLDLPQKLKPFLTWVQSIATSIYYLYLFSGVIHTTGW